MTAGFELHSRLAADCIRVGRLPLSLLLLLNDARYPWFILVPQRSGIGEIFQLPESDQCQLWRESANLSHNLMQSFHADKINIGAWVILCPNCMCIILRDSPAIRPGPARCGGIVPRCPMRNTPLANAWVWPVTGLAMNWKFFSVNRP